jgi:hypothetical protein
MNTPLTLNAELCAERDATVCRLVAEMVRALPAVALGEPRRIDARTRAAEFAAAFAARRTL